VAGGLRFFCVSSVFPCGGRPAFLLCFFCVSPVAADAERARLLLQDLRETSEPASDER
jgi:hypothetical protein